VLDAQRAALRTDRSRIVCRQNRCRITRAKSRTSLNFVGGKRIIILDGDTVALPCASPAPGCAEKIRFIDIDAPETFHPDADAGLAAGLKAKARLAELIRGHQIWVERYNRKDRYRRTLAALRIDNQNGVNAGLQLVREDLALPWKSGAAAKAQQIAHWCGRSRPLPIDRSK